MRFVVIVLILINIFSLSGQNKRSVLERLDSLVENRDYFIEKRNSQLVTLKQLYNKANDEREKYNIGNEIFRLYSKFDKDSAIFYVNANYDIAVRMNDKEKIVTSRMNYVFMMAALGMYKECFDYLPKFAPDSYSPKVRYQYYKLCEYVYQGLRVYSAEPYSSYYKSKIDSIYDMILSDYDSSSTEYKEAYIKKSYNDKDFKTTIKLIEDYMHNIPYDTNEYAMMLYILANSYKEIGDEENYLNYMSNVAEVDIITAVKEYRALKELAEYLYSKGDIERAYRYSRRSLEDAELFNARQQTLEVARIQPIINEAYQKQIKDNERKFKNLSLLLAICLLMLLAAILFIIRQMKLLKAADENNKNLILHLSEVNHIKEEYIGHFMKLCSEYIIKIDEFRILVNRKLKSGQYDDLHKLTSNKKLIDKEQEELYRKFDTSFLQLYPNFVSDINNLLKEELRFELKKDELLNNELRICALIKLGIRDSSHISEFLGYSPNTIYTYRTKVRNRAINRESFEKDIVNLGNVY